jgi:hypothetical protein
MIKSNNWRVEMNKECTFILFFFIIISGIFPVNLKITGYGSEITLTDEKIIITDEFWNENPEEYDITWEIQGELSYITFNYTGKSLGKNINHGIKKYLVLYGNPYIVLFDENNKMVQFVFGWKYTMMLDFTAMATSELVERNTTYNSSNIVDVFNLIPWAEGVNGSGIGEIITFIPKYSLHSRFGLYFIISNGYVDYNRPYLYNYNNRVKKIRIYVIGYDNKIEFKDLEITDTPNYQGFYLKFGEDAYNIEQIKVEILEVYRGDRYDDTCINFLNPGGF